jgi:hypothetical protein
MSEESDRLQFHFTKSSFAVTFDGKAVPAEKLDALFGLLAADVDRRMKQLSDAAHVPLMCKNETVD